MMQSQAMTSRVREKGRRDRAVERAEHLEGD